MQVKLSVFEISGSFLIFKVRYKALLKKKSRLKFMEGIVHQKMKILSLITHPHVIPNMQELCSSSEHKLRFFFVLNPRALRPCIDSKGPTTFKVQ